MTEQEKQQTVALSPYDLDHTAGLVSTRLPSSQSTGARRWLGTPDHPVVNDQPRHFVLVPRITCSEHNCGWWTTVYCRDCLTDHRKQPAL